VIKRRIVIVGGGPAGMMAAIRAAELLQDVTLVEKNSSLGSKLLLSGKGRCNLTNACDLDAFLKRFSRNGQFLRDAFAKFFNRELIGFFEKNGLRLKIERQGRVFPVADQSPSVIEALSRKLRETKVKVLCRFKLKAVIVRQSKAEGVLLDNGQSIAADRVILATGGVSYPFTGSTGEGLNIAKELGHCIVGLRPGLVPLETAQRYPAALRGLVLKNIRLRFSNGRRQIVSDIGEMTFTESGISGALVLSLSSRIADWLEEKNKVFAEIDLKPALSKEQLDARLLREFQLDSRKAIKNLFKNLLPKKIASLFVDICGIAPDKKAGQITQDERRRLVYGLKAWRMDITKARPIEEAMVTRGGVSLKEINPRTMESRIIKGLYFAGEMIDVDADTGGFNLQAAFSTGYLAGESAARL
jgi:predicted Rossmann fold flavoprotein